MWYYFPCFFIVSASWFQFYDETQIQCSLLIMRSETMHSHGDPLSEWPKAQLVNGTGSYHQAKFERSCLNISKFISLKCTPMWRKAACSNRIDNNHTKFRLDQTGTCFTFPTPLWPCNNINSIKSGSTR